MEHRSVIQTYGRRHRNRVVTLWQPESLLKDQNSFVDNVFPKDSQRCKGNVTRKQ